MASTKNTEDLFYQQLQSLWSVENMLMEALPRMIEKADNLGLQKSLAHHLAETNQHRVAIEGICKQLNIDAQEASPNVELKNILKEGEKAMANKSTGSTMDAAIITGAQKVEQYEIHAYASAADYANTLGYQGFKKRLLLTLEEERQAFTKLKFMESSLFSTRAEIGQVSVI